MSEEDKYNDLKEETEVSGTQYVRANPMVTRVGFVDLGSNSSRLTVVEFDIRGRVTVLNRVKSMVRLGEGAFETKLLQPAARARALGCLKEFVQVCDSYGVRQIIAVGTAALRAATNSQEFVHDVKVQTGMDLQVISGDEEARLIRVGIWHSFPKTRDAFLFIDIGGGSTELSVSSRTDIRMMESMNVGCVMVTDAFKGGKDGKISSSIFQKMQNRALEKMQRAFTVIKKEQFKAAVASSGTAQSLLSLAQARLGPGDSFQVTPEGTVLPRAKIESLAKELSQMSLEQRKSLPGLSPARAEVIVGGAAILLTILQSLKLDSVIVTSSNLQDGQVVDYIERHYPQKGQEENSWRKKSVRALTKHFHYEKAHAKHVSRLAVAIYQSAVNTRLCDPQADLEELLGYAGRLHDIGIDLAYDKHYQHGAYLVRFTPMLGFTDGEVLTMARLVYLHSRPSAELPAFLAGEEMTQSERLAALSLFLAENLDRTHRALVTHAEFVRETKGSVTLCVEARDLAPIEKAGIEKMKKHVKKLLGLSIGIEFIEPKQEMVELIYD